MMDNEVLLYAAQMLAYPDKQFRWSKTMNRLEEYRENVLHGDWSWCASDFDPIHNDSDWVKLRERLERKVRIGVLPDRHDTALYNTEFLSGFDVHIDVVTIMNLKNSCPRQLALDICAVLCKGEDDG